MATPLKASSPTSIYPPPAPLYSLFTSPHLHWALIPLFLLLAVASNKPSSLILIFPSSPPQFLLFSLLILSVLWSLPYYTSYFHHCKCREKHTPSVYCLFLRLTKPLNHLPLQNSSSSPPLHKLPKPPFLILFSSPAIPALSPQKPCPRWFLLLLAPTSITINFTMFLFPFLSVIILVYKLFIILLHFPFSPCLPMHSSLSQNKSINRYFHHSTTGYSSNCTQEAGSAKKCCLHWLWVLDVYRVMIQLLFYILLNNRAAQWGHSFKKTNTSKNKFI